MTSASILTCSPAPIRRMSTGYWFTLILLLLVSLSLTVPIVKAQEESLEDFVNQYETEYKEFLKTKAKRDSFPPDSDERQEMEDQMFNMQRGLDFLKRAISELGGNVSDIEDRIKGGDKKGDLKIPAEGRLKMELDETTKEVVSPKDFYPWQIKNWPSDARSMGDNNRLYIALRTLEQYQPEWATKHRRLLKTMNKAKRHQYYIDAVKKVYEDLYGIIFEVEVLAKPELKSDVKKFTGKFAGDRGFANKLLHETIDKYTAKTKSKGTNWHWLDLGLRSSEIHQEYEKAQKEMRRILLTEYDSWDRGRYNTWESEMSAATEKIIAIERKMLWLLGYNQHLDDLEKLEKLYKIKIEQLPPLQKKLVRYNIGLKYFRHIKKFIDVSTTSNDPGVAHKKKQASEATARDIKKIQNWLSSADQKTGKLVRDLRKSIDEIGGREAIMKTGVQRAIELGLFKPHRRNKRGDTFYKSILGAEEYRRLEGNFPSLRQDSVYMEFLQNEKEQRKFRKQNSMRRRMLRSG